MIRIFKLTVCTDKDIRVLLGSYELGYADGLKQSLPTPPWNPIDIKNLRKLAHNIRRNL